MRSLSQHVAPPIDLGVGTFGGHGTVQRVLGRLKEEGDILPKSSLPTLISDSALRREKHGEDRSLPTCTFGIGDVKEEERYMTYAFYDRSSMLSLWRIDPYWKSPLLVDSKDIFTCMIIDDQLLEEGYLVRDEVIYYHGRIFLSRASKFKEK